MSEDKWILNKYWLALKALIFSMYYQIWLSTNNFNKIKSLHSLIDNDVEIAYTEEELLKIHQILLAMRKVEKRAFWNPKCYNLALVARKLLKEQKITCVLKIGFRKRNNQIEGHAWVLCNKTIITGFLPDLKTYNILKSVKNKSH